jgi:hypothetical protein
LLSTEPNQNDFEDEFDDFEDEEMEDEDFD